MFSVFCLKNKYYYYLTRFIATRSHARKCYNRRVFHEMCSVTTTMCQIQQGTYGAPISFQPPSHLRRFLVMCIRRLSTWSTNAKSYTYTGLSMSQTQKYPLALAYHLLWTSSEDVIFTARCTTVQSAVLRSHGVRPSVRNVGGSGPHRLEVLETNCMNN